MSLNMNHSQQARNTGKANQVAALWLLLGLLWPVYSHGQQVNDLLQMDIINAGKTDQSLKKNADSYSLVPRLNQEDTIKYQAVIASMKGKNGDEILEAMQAANADSLAKMSPSSRKSFEDLQKKIQADLKSGAANPEHKSIDAIRQRMYLRLLGIEPGDGKQMTAQQKAYFEHNEAKIRQKYFSPERSESYRRLAEESHAYLMQNLDKQAEYARNFKSSAGAPDQTRASPLPMDVLKSNWLVRKMATQNPAELTPKASSSVPINVNVVRAQIDDLSLQLRSGKAMSVTERYGSNASIVSEADAKSKMQEQVRNGSLATNIPSSSVNGVDKSKAPPEASARKTSAIPGL